MAEEKDLEGFDASLLRSLIELRKDLKEYAVYWSPLGGSWGSCIREDSSLPPELVARAQEFLRDLEKLPLGEGAWAELGTIDERVRTSIEARPEQRESLAELVEASRNLRPFSTLWPLADADLPHVRILAEGAPAPAGPQLSASFFDVDPYATPPRPESEEPVTWTLARSLLAVLRAVSRMAPLRERRRRLEASLRDNGLFWFPSGAAPCVREGARLAPRLVEEAKAWILDMEKVCLGEADWQGLVKVETEGFADVSDLGQEFIQDQMAKCWRARPLSSSFEPPAELLPPVHLLEPGQEPVEGEPLAPVEWNERPALTTLVALLRAVSRMEIE
jgi:hypothetical protein